MSLIIKPPSWGHCTTNLSGTPNIAALGTAVTAGANNADDAAVSLISAITHDVEFLQIYFQDFFAPGANCSTLVDVLIDPAGGTSWLSAPLISDLLASSGTNGVTTAPWRYYHFPVWIKSGTSIGAQARNAQGVTAPGRVIVYASGGNSNPGSWWCGQHVESVGVTAASSQGTNHTAGNSGSYSAWTNLGSTLSAPCGALQFAVQGTNTDTTQNSASYFYEFGVSSTRIGPPIVKSTSTSELGWQPPSGPIFCALASGAQLQVRGTCSGTAEVQDVAAYAVM